jgi:hypothetical protein
MINKKYIEELIRASEVYIRAAPGDRGLDGMGPGHDLTRAIEGAKKEVRRSEKEVTDMIKGVLGRSWSSLRKES